MSSMAYYLPTRSVCQFLSLILIGILVYIFIRQSSKLFKGSTEWSSSDIYIIDKSVTDAYSFTLMGELFDDKGTYSSVKHKIAVGKVHWFSPQVEEEAAQKFFGPPYENQYTANEAAILNHNGEIMMVARVWLNKKKLWGTDTDDRHLGFKKPPQKNNFNDNWLLYQRFNQSLSPITYSSILGIPAPSQYKYMDGPSDPRLFTFRNQPYLLFNMDMALNKTTDINYPLIWDFHNKGPIWIDIEGGSPFWSTSQSGYVKDRHWSPLVSDENLYFIHSLDPMRVLSCELSDEKCRCKFISYTDGGFLFNDGITHLRGGTPFILYKRPYYIGFAHSALHKTSQRDSVVYSTHLIVLSVEPTFRIVFVSEPITPHPLLLEEAAKLRKANVGIDEFILPVSLLQEAPDIYGLTVNVNDQGSSLLRITGLEAILEEVTSLDRNRKPSTGPKMNSVQFYVHESMSDILRTEIVHQEL